MDVVERIREICLAFPGANERPSHGAPAFFAGKQFVIVWAHGHHDHTFAHMWCAAPEGAQRALVNSSPDRFFVPPYVGHRGWVGVHLDNPIDDDLIEMLCLEAYRSVATATMLRALDTAQAT